MVREGGQAARLKGKAFEICYADDAALFFEYREDAQKVFEVLPKRFAKFGLTPHPQRLIEFGRRGSARDRRMVPDASTR
jgi:RNA-directed DNA polymerase